MKNEGNLINDWLEKYADPEIDKFVEKNLSITEKVRLALEEKKWTFQDLANAMDKSPSEVSKWLTGLHNLTLKSIIKLEMALGIDLINIEETNKDIKYVYLGTIKSDNSENENDDYQEAIAV